MKKLLKGARIVPTSEYNIHKKQINPHALFVLEGLKQAGFQAYVVGGGVRDLLLGRRPKDFDVATNAKPYEIKQVFRNCRLIGRRFRLAHVYFKREIVEVATFRGAHQDAEAAQDCMRDGMIIRDNVYGTIRQDAYRRDFTVNALYYDAIDSELLDFVGGFEDLNDKVLRVIGEPAERYREDPVRMLRAVRFIGKLGFVPAIETEKAILELSHLVGYVPSARLHDEVLKLFCSGFSSNIFNILRKYGLLWQLFPLVAQDLDDKVEGTSAMVRYLLRSTDQRVHAEKSVAPHFLFATLLWYPFLRKWKALRAEHLPKMRALSIAADDILHEQRKHIAVPKRIMFTVEEIWKLQCRLESRSVRSIMLVLQHARFRAAYDLLMLRAQCDKHLQSVAAWWEKIQMVDAEQKERMIAGLMPNRRKRSREKRRRYRG